MEGMVEGECVPTFNDGKHGDMKTSRCADMHSYEVAMQAWCMEGMKGMCAHVW
jgi:hypothetical protein